MTGFLATLAARAVGAPAPLRPRLPQPFETADRASARQPAEDGLLHANPADVPDEPAQPRQPQPSEPGSAKYTPVAAPPPERSGLPEQADGRAAVGPEPLVPSRASADPVLDTTVLPTRPHPPELDEPAIVRARQAARRAAQQAAQAAPEPNSTTTPPGATRSTTTPAPSPPAATVDGDDAATSSDQLPAEGTLPAPRPGALEAAIGQPVTATPTSTGPQRPTSRPTPDAGRRARPAPPPPTVDLAALLRDEVVAALAERGVVAAREPIQVTEPGSPSRAARPGVAAVRADDVDVRSDENASGGGDVHVHIGRVSVTRPAPAPSNRAPRSAVPRVDHAAYLARRRERG